MKSLTNSLKGNMVDKSPEMSEQFSIIGQFNDKKRTKMPKKVDMFGNEVKVGDLILGIYQNRPSIGVVMHIGNNVGMCDVQYTKDGKDVKKTPSGEYMSRTAMYDIIKISDKIAEKLFEME